MLRLRTLLLFTFVLSDDRLTLAAAAEPAAATQSGASDLEEKLAESRRLHLTNSTRSRALAEEALAMARDRRDSRNEAAAHVELAIALRRQNHNGIAVQHVRQALEIVERISDGPLLRRAFKEAGHTFWAFGDMANATDYLQRLLKLSEEDGDLGAQSDALAGLGAVASDLDEDSRSRSLKERALTLAERAGDKTRIALYAGNLGHSLLSAQDYASARRNYERALAIFEELGERTNADDSRMDLARIDQAEGNFGAAEQALRQMLPARRRLKGRIKLTTTLVQLADVLRLQGKLDEPLLLLKEASEYAHHLSAGMKMLVLDAWVAAYEARGDHVAAFAALRQRQTEAEKQQKEASQARTLELREAFNAERSEAQIVRLRQASVARNAELRAKDAELRAQQAERSRAQWQSYGLITALALGLIALGAIVSRQKLKARTTRRILEEAQAARKAAEEADRVKTRFLGIASHDIRGPLGNIINLTASLRLEGPQTDVSAERCDMIGSEAQRVICLVEDLITTAALEAGRLEIRKAPMDLGESTRAVIESLRWQAEGKRQTVRFAEPVAGAGRLEGDEPRLYQVIANLLSNAIKFSPVGGEILVKLTRNADHVSLSIRDCGAGISTKDIPRLFAPFERLSTHPTAGESSHGLGLSIAQEIVRRHDGIIDVESSPGAGATFLVRLPISGKNEAAISGNAR